MRYQRSNRLVEEPLVEKQQLGSFRRLAPTNFLLHNVTKVGLEAASRGQITHYVEEGQM